MQRTKKLEENKIKTREQNKGRKIKNLLSSPIHLACHCSTVEPILLRCRPDIATLSLCCRSAVAPLSRRCRTAIAPLSRRCQTAVAPAQRGYKKFNIELLFLYCHSTVTSAVNRKFHTVVASRGIIRVTVTIGDCQARVSSSSEGCSTWQKTVKV